MTFSFCLSDSAHGILQTIRDFDVTHLHRLYFDTPGLGLRVQGIGHGAVQSGAVREHLTEVRASDDVTQGGLSGADDGLRWALAAVVGADQTEGHWRTARGRLSLVATVPAGPGNVHLNVGRYRDIPSQLLATTWGAAYEWNPLPVGTTAWAPMVELFGTRDMGSTLSLGLRGTLIEDKLYLNLAFGQERREPRTRLTSVGLRWAF